MTQRLLLVDDDVELCELLAAYLGPEGFEVEARHDGITGLEAALGERFGLVVLDVMLPGLGGLEVLRRIRERSRIPVLMLTAKGDDVDRIVGLEMGADDYLGKPFNPREMLARIRAIGRRTQPPEDGRAPARQLLVGDVALDPGAREATLRGAALDLTAVEFSLLELLLRDAGTVVTREVLSRQVLGRDPSPVDRSIDVHISNLRRKLGPDARGGERIRTVRGVGYLYAAPALATPRGPA